MNSKRNLMIEYKVHKTAPEVAILILIKCISQFSNVQNLKNLKHVDKKITNKSHILICLKPFQQY